MTDKMFNPYLRRRVVYQDAVREFRHFLEDAQTVALAEIEEIERARPLKRFNAFLAHPVQEFRTFQAWFGVRPTGRPTNSSLRKPVTGSQVPGPSKKDSEIGGHLVYSLGPTGHVAIFLYPAHSDLHRGAREDVIILCLKRLSGYRLKNRLRRDLKKLVAYTYVTSLDGEPTLGEKIIIGWLRLTCRIQIDGEQVVRGQVYSVKIGDFIARSGMAALMKPMAFLLFAGVLLWLGWSQLATMFLR